MQTYKAEDLDNKALLQQAEDAHDQGLPGKESLSKIKALFSFNLYTPNIFIRIALALLCIVCAVFTAFLFFLMFSSSGNISAIILLLLVLSYGLLEYLIKTKHFYNAGIDNTLQVFTILLFAGLFVTDDYSGQDIFTTSAVLVCSMWLCIRFTDAFMALIAYCAYLVLIVLVCKYTINITYIPFILMAASSAVVYLQYYLKKKQRLRFYHKCFDVLRTGALISFYTACNIYIVHAGHDILKYDTPANTMYLNILWVFNFLIPLGYLFYGFRKKDVLFLRIGFLLLIATLVTVHYYYSFGSIEIVLIIGGCLLIALSYAGMRYFKNGKYGFTSKSVKGLRNDLKNLEILISIQGSNKNLHPDNFEFGGGSSGGAGASGNW